MHKKHVLKIQPIKILKIQPIQNIPTIYLFNLYFYLFFLERSEVHKFVDIRAWITQNKTWLFMVAVSAVKRSFWWWISTAEVF